MHGFPRSVNPGDNDYEYFIQRIFKKTSATDFKVINQNKFLCGDYAGTMWGLCGDYVGTM